MSIGNAAPMSARGPPRARTGPDRTLIRHPGSPEIPPTLRRWHFSQSPGTRLTSRKDDDRGHRYAAQTAVPPCTTCPGTTQYPTMYPTHHTRVPPPGTRPLPCTARHAHPARPVPSVPGDPPKMTLFPDKVLYLAVFLGGVLDSGHWKHGGLHGPVLGLVGPSPSL